MKVRNDCGIVNGCHAEGKAIPKHPICFVQGSNIEACTEVSDPVPARIIRICMLFVPGSKIQDGPGSYRRNYLSNTRPNRPNVVQAHVCPGQIQDPSDPGSWILDSGPKSKAFAIRSGLAQREPKTHHVGEPDTRTQSVLRHLSLQSKQTVPFTSGQKASAKRPVHMGV